MLYNETLIRVHVKINPNANVLNMNCYYMYVTLHIMTPRKIQHHSCN